MPDIEVTIAPGSTVALTVNHADNQTEVRINNGVVYQRATEYDPTLNETIDLSAHFRQGGRKVITVVGRNWGGPAHYKGQIVSSVGGGNPKVISHWDYYQANAPFGETVLSSVVTP